MSLSQNIVASSLLQLKPKRPNDYDCIESCFEFASSCWICVDASLNERDHSHLNECIKLSLSCAELCAQAARMLIFQDDYTAEEIEEKVRACIELCKLCLAEYTPNSARHEHCLISARCAQDCIRSCENYLERNQLLKV
ncbi:MAG TPA: hypothetical protein VNJ01_04800 [Bacteriovoracaceae bacterium]|nr:hypothetical protein [Bacteriovoracaceae bacterium]